MLNLAAMFGMAFWAAQRTDECLMKRVAYLIVLLAVATAFYVYAYPRLAGKAGVADAQQADSTGGRRGGNFAVSVVSAVARKQTLPITKSAVGYIEPDETVVVRARANGTVVATNVTEGQMVKAGDVLFKLDDSAQQATIAKDQAQILKDQANAKSAQATLERDQNLIKKEVIPQSTVDADLAAADAANATVGVDQAQLKSDQVALGYMTIAAPIAGRIGTVNTSVGNVVSSTDTSAGGLVTITPMNPLRVSFNIPESDLDSFRAALAGAKPAQVSIRAPDDTSDRAEGKLSFIDSSVDTGSGTIDVKADVDNSAGKLWPGQYVTATTTLGAYDNVTTIPVVAVQESDSGSFAFVVGSDSKVKRVPVTVTATIGDTAIVGDTIKPGDHVVTEGQLRISDGATVRETLQSSQANVASNSGDDTDGAGGAGMPGRNSAPSGADASAGNS
jgi:membrane fusion protein, multidrug efflux system